MKWLNFGNKWCAFRSILTCPLTSYPHRPPKGAWRGVESSCDLPYPQTWMTNQTRCCRSPFSSNVVSTYHQFLNKTVRFILLVGLIVLQSIKKYIWAMLVRRLIHVVSVFAFVFFPSCEDDEFDGRWEIPLERTLDQSIDQSAVTSRKRYVNVWRWL